MVDSVKVVLVGDAGEHPCGSPAAVTFEVELAFEGLVD
jgi:hypothetical protein